jgi:hypothetical protein
MGQQSAVKAIQAQFAELVQDPPPGINAVSVLHCGKRHSSINPGSG